MNTSPFFIYISSVDTNPSLKGNFFSQKLSTYRSGSRSYYAPLKMNTSPFFIYISFLDTNPTVKSNYLVYGSF